jgi:hypothetical protein
MSATIVSPWQRLLGYLCLLSGLTSIVFFMSPIFAIPAATIALALAKVGFTPGAGTPPGHRKSYAIGAITAVIGLLLTAMPHVPLYFWGLLQGS